MYSTYKRLVLEDQRANLLRHLITKYPASWLSAQCGVDKAPSEIVGAIWEGEYEAMVNCYVYKVKKYADAWLDSASGKAIREKIAEHKYIPIVLTWRLTEGPGRSSPPGRSRQRT
jgi:hypothetical protein